MRNCATALLLALLLLALALPAWAQATPPPAFGPATPGAAPPSAFGPASPGTAQGASDASQPIAAPLHASGALAGFLSWVMDTQQRWQRRLADEVENLRDGNPLIAALALAGLSFGYGVLHAVGPGHGKTIISSYVTANEETARRGILICILASIVQASSAVALVVILAVILNATGMRIKAWSIDMETVSYALIALVGVWLLFRQLQTLWQRWRRRHPDVFASNRPQLPLQPVQDLALAAGPDAMMREAAPLHDHDDAHRHDHHHHSHVHGAAAPAHDHDHDHDHVHDADCGCGHHHLPDLDTLSKPLNLRQMAAVVLSVGVRPCSGAIVVLVFALTQGLFWAGIAATFAMSIGTAVTVAAIALFALSWREMALKLGGRQGAWASAVWTVCGLGGSLLIIVFGSVLFMVSMGPARPF
jgi:nickel/cobalt transporter (NicO) family protein